MLRWFLFVFCVVKCLFVWSQNWALFSSEKVYFYATSEVEVSDRFTLVVGVKGAQVLGEDSVFSMYKSYRSSQVNTMANSSWVNEPGPFGNDVTLNESEVRFGAPLHSLLQAKAPLHSFWWTNDTQSAEATVTEVSEAEVFGVPDSVKVINTTDGQEWVLSKNHGIVKYKNVSGVEYALRGIHQEVGEQMPGNPDFFRFEVGDAFNHVSTLFRTDWANLNPAQGNYQWNISALSAGTYVLKFLSDGNQWQYRFMKT